MVWSYVYLALGRVFELVMLCRQSAGAKEIEILVLGHPGSAVRRHTGVIAALMLQVSAVGWSDQASIAPKCGNTTGSE